MFYDDIPYGNKLITNIFSLICPDFQSKDWILISAELSLLLLFSPIIILICFCLLIMNFIASSINLLNFINLENLSPNHTIIIDALLAPNFVRDKSVTNFVHKTIAAILWQDLNPPLENRKIIDSLWNLFIYKDLSDQTERELFYHLTSPAGLTFRTGYGSERERSILSEAANVLKDNNDKVKVIELFVIKFCRLCLLEYNLCSNYELKHKIAELVLNAIDQQFTIITNTIITNMLVGSNYRLRAISFLINHFFDKHINNSTTVSQQIKTEIRNSLLIDTRNPSLLNLENVLAIFRICILLNKGQILNDENLKKIIDDNDAGHLTKMIALLGQETTINQDKFKDIFNRTKINNIIDKAYKDGETCMLPVLFNIISSYNRKIPLLMHTNENTEEENDSKSEPAVGTSSLTSP